MVFRSGLKYLAGASTRPDGGTNVHVVGICGVNRLQGK